MIEVNGLTKRYGKLTAIDDISFHVRAGETFALLGPNGSGKSTILKCLAGLVLADSGRVRIRDIEVRGNRRAVNGLLSYLPQRVTFEENLTARELLHFYCRLRRLSLDRADQVLKQFAFGFDGFQNKPVGEFSGGMIQRLGIAIAFLPDAPLLILDEPAVSLDPEGAVRFREVTESLKAEGRTIVFYSHVLSDVELLADRVAVLVGGRLVSVERGPRLRSRSDSGARLRVWLRNAGERLAAAAVRAGACQADLAGDTLVLSCLPEQRLPILHAIEEAGGSIVRFSTEEPSLEEIYLGYVHANGSDPRVVPAVCVRDTPPSAG
jgi:ABC-type multidrug transport system ATPase subunit